MTNILTKKQQEILQLKSQKMSNANIARKLGVTDAAISLTFKRLSEKVKGVNGTLQLMREIGFIEKAPPIELTEIGFDQLKIATKIDIKAQKKRTIKTLRERNPYIAHPVIDSSDIVDKLLHIKGAADDLLQSMPSLHTISSTKKLSHRRTMSSVPTLLGLDSSYLPYR